MRAERVQRLLRALSRGERSGRLRGLSQVLLGLLLPRTRQLAAHATLELARELRKLLLVALEARLPFRFPRPTALARVPAGTNVLGNHERLVLPAQVLARRSDLVDAERGTVRGFGALLVRRAEADDRLAADQARPIALGLGGGD